MSLEKIILPIIEDFNTLEQVWENPYLKNKLIEDLKNKIQALKTHPDSRVAKQAELAVHLQSNSQLAHLMNFVIPFERLLDRNIKDDDFLVTSVDKNQESEKVPLIVVADNIRSAFNIGSIFRTSECLGAEKIFLTGYSSPPTEPKTAKTAMGTERFVTWESGDLEKTLPALKNEGYQIVALETAASAEDLFSFKFQKKTALVLGNERFGIDNKILKQADRVLRIPVYGNKNSLNVGVALATVGYEYRRQQESARTYSPIGILRCDRKQPYEAARQGVIDNEVGVIHLATGHNFEQALIDLAGFERVWLLYEFHHNQNWKPMVQPPRGTDHKVGVFATRAPYRPNPIGLSCVRLKKIEGLKLSIENHDLLDGTPILDIKPYIPYADSFPDSKMGWLEEIEEQRYQVSFEEQAQKQLEWLSKNGLSHLRQFCIEQLSFHPTDSSRKRIKFQREDIYILAYRTWRIEFQLSKVDQKIKIVRIYSGYSQEEIQNSDDPYKDKDLHKNFNSSF